jgi:acetate kinase
VKPAGPLILTINGGSSSIKFALFEASPSLKQRCAGAIERIGHPQAIFRVKGPRAADDVSRPLADVDHARAVHVLLDWLEQHPEHLPLAAAGHRVVHGGPDYSAPQLISDAMLDAVRRLTPFDPEHLPGELLLIEAVRRRFPALPQFACFDTAFHHDLPRVARLLPIPRRYEAQGIRRYGFHGLSYQFLMDALGRLSDPAAGTGRVILAHLGHGASLAAVRDGRSIDTSMGFTPTAGVPMGTRSGDLDPGLAGYLARTQDMSARQFSAMANEQSGLLGISETSDDMRDLLQHETTDLRAAEAVAVFCYQVRKCIGAFAAALGGLDTLVFAGGIGENAAPVRERVCAGLGFLGVALDPARNARHAALISGDAGRVRVRVMHTDEERMIATSVAGVLALDPPREP